jgi:hypothetical protein
MEKVLDCPFGSPAMKVFISIVCSCLSFSSRLIELNTLHFTLTTTTIIIIFLYVYMCIHMYLNDPACC